jgi:hypothetical protein
MVIPANTKMPNSKTKKKQKNIYIWHKAMRKWAKQFRVWNFLIRKKKGQLSLSNSHHLHQRHIFLFHFFFFLLTCSHSDRSSTREFTLSGRVPDS